MADDRQAIVDVIHAYCRLIDGRRPDEQVLLFTDDCRVRYGREWIEGRADLEAFLRRAIESFAATSHLVGNIEVDFSGPDRARSESVLQAWHRLVDGDDLVVHGRYHDTWLRTGDGWHIQTRELTIAGTEGKPVQLR